MAKVLMVLLLLAVAQIFPSCGDRGASGDGASSTPEVIGWVQEKRARVWEAIPHIIVIDQVEHGVPYEFWLSVDAGDLVKRVNGIWSIVRKARR